MSAKKEFLGIVRDGLFHALTPPGAEDNLVRLTAIAMQVSVPVERGELDLTRYEGQAIMVQGHDGGGWIYSAQVIDQAGPILTAVVQQVFSSADTPLLTNSELPGDGTDNHQ